MKGDFSFLALNNEPHYSGVLHQQGRVLLDRDWNEAVAIASAWQTAIGRDTFGDGVLAVPSANTTAFRLVGAKTDGTIVTVDIDAGRAWADGLSLMLDAPSTFAATYFGAPFQSPQAATLSIADGVRDLVVLDVWEDTVSGFQDMLELIEPALGGPDTTERMQAFFNLKLLRLGPNDDCSAVASLADAFAAKGKLTVSPAPLLAITGDCPVEAGGGYTGLAHYLYRIEIADPDAGGAARFKWSQWNGGLVGRGLFAPGLPGTATVTISANDQMISYCGVTDFYLEALALDTALGSWRITLTADATLLQNGILSLTNMQGTWPVTTPASGFFRLWNGIARITDFPVEGPNPVELKDGIRLEFDAPIAGNANYLPGDYWTFPVRVSGAAFEPSAWLTNAVPQGVHHRRVALGILNWSGSPPATLSFTAGDIDDCRRVFRPLTNQKVCCTFNVGDGRTSHGDFDSIEEALKHLPLSGGEICLLPGLHQTNAVILGRQNVKIKGCDVKTKVIPRKGSAVQPIFTIADSRNVSLERIDMVTLGGTAIVVGAQKGSGVFDIEIAHNRILACTNAIHARNAKGVSIHHNLIRMLDKQGSDVAIYLAGDDGLIERNDLRLVPARSMPPIDVPTEPNPVDPNDPCAKLEFVYVNPRFFIDYVNAVWAVKLPTLVPLAQPYRALGGIQLGGGSERIRVFENTIVGGAGNGVTLGNSVLDVPAEPDYLVTLPQKSPVVARVLGPDAKPRAGVQFTLMNTAIAQASQFVTDANGTFTFGGYPATFRITEGDPGFSIDTVDLTPVNQAFFALTITMKADEVPPTLDAGFLYDITIDGNMISAMGLSGIGVTMATAPTSDQHKNALARSQLGTPIVGLAIRGNRVEGCLVAPFDNALRAMAASQGLGGISLGMCEKLSIVENQIEANGVSGVNPVCGIYVAYGEDVEIARNRLVGNGSLTQDVTAKDLIPGWRGGIVLNLVSNFNLFDARAVAQGETFSQWPAVRIHENLIEQPVGLALYATVFGPVQCTNNAFCSEMSGLSVPERLAGTVFLFDLGGVTNARAGVKLRRAAVGGDDTTSAPADANAPAPAAGAQPSDGVAPAVLAPQRVAAVDMLFPTGNMTFSGNQSRTGQANTSVTCQVVATLDDLAWQNNQSFSLRSGNLLSNGLLFGNTVRVTGNRLSERGAQTPLSLLTIGVRLNNTSFNQGDHCIVAVDMNPAMAEVKAGNQVLNPSELCASRSIATGVLFKPHR